MFKETDLLTVEEAAGYLKLSTRTVLRRIDEKKLPAFRVLGDSLRIRMSDLQAAIAQMPTNVSTATRSKRGRPKTQVSADSGEEVAS